MSSLDITQDLTNLSITERLNQYHTATATLRNTSRRYNYTESNYNLMEKPRAKITIGSRTFKFTIIGPSPDVSGDATKVQLASASYDLKGAIAQIRCQNASDGNFYLEDVLYRALYDTGMHNFFLIKLQNGEYYTPTSSHEYKIKIDSLDDIVYTRISVYEILQDLCSKAGIVWYEEDLSSSSDYSVLNLVKIETEYDVPADNILYVSTADNTVSVAPNRSYDTMSNMIYFDKLPFAVMEAESISRYGMRNPRKITYDEDGGDVGKHMKSAYSLRSIVKDPIVSIPITVHGIVDIGNLGKFVKVQDSTGDYDKYAGIDKMYRINSVKYDFNKDQTTINIGNEFRKFKEEQLEDLSKGNENTEDSNETQNIGKGVLNDASPLRFQVYTDGSYHDDTFTYTSGGYGVRMGIDHAYHATYSPNGKIYMTTDGVRTGN